MSVSYPGCSSDADAVQHLQSLPQEVVAQYTVQREHLIYQLKQKNDQLEQREQQLLSQGQQIINDQQATINSLQDLAHPDRISDRTSSNLELESAYQRELIAGRTSTSKSIEVSTSFDITSFDISHFNRSCSSRSGSVT